ncbi:MAG TPA: hypothetical protein VH419_03440, partial [Nocardioidaceae bacterium]
MPYSVAEAEALRRFIKQDLLASVLSAALLLGLAVVLSEPWFIAVSAAAAGVAVSLVFARRLTTTDPAKAVHVIADANWLCAVVVTAIVPVALDITPLIVLMPLVLAIPYLPRRAFAGLIGAGVVVSVVLAMVGRLQEGAGLEAQAADWL